MLISWGAKTIQSTIEWPKVELLNSLRAVEKFCLNNNTTSCMTFFVASNLSSSVAEFPLRA